MERTEATRTVSAQLPRWDVETGYRDALGHPPYALDAASGTPHRTYVDADGERHGVWYRDANGAATHPAVPARHGVRGVGLWALGFEEADLRDAP
ncbi:hypothetical protein ACIRP0_07565 [Streptomyces sp. NPDC101733]|uniref:hypothetical protein n=1 Tax=unclassified Streptomyces TaxID=2593676 RepID=UPI00380FE655